MSEIVKVKKNKRFVVGDEIKFIGEIQECDKPEFIEIPHDALMGMFKDLAKVNDDGEIGPEPLGSEYNLHEIYDAEWYAERFPGFTAEEYFFMSKADKEDNLRLELENNA